MVSSTPKSPKSPSSPFKMRPASIINRTIDGGITKKKKKSKRPGPKSPSALTPDRCLRHSQRKRRAALHRAVQAFVTQDVWWYCGYPDPDPMEDVRWYCGYPDPDPMEDVVMECNWRGYADPGDAMDTREDYEWDYPGFDGYLLQEFASKVGQFPEMRLSAADQVLYYLGEITAEGIA